MTTIMMTMTMTMTMTMMMMMMMMMMMIFDHQAFKAARDDQDILEQRHFQHILDTMPEGGSFRYVNNGTSGHLRKRDLISTRKTRGPMGSRILLGIRTDRPPRSRNNAGLKNHPKSDSGFGR